MKESFMTPIQKCIESVLDDVLAARDIDHASLQKGLKLRPPKNEAWGDLCTNVLLLIKPDSDSDSDSERVELAAKFIGVLEDLPMIKSADLSDAGYINLYFYPDYWGTQLPTVFSMGASFGLEVGPKEIILEKPEDSDDLRSARQVWNCEALEKIAVLTQSSVIFEPWDSGGLKGYSSAMAIAKCTENTLRYSLLATGEEFTIHFSPVLATDKAYSNPAFCIPFAHARLQSLLNNAGSRVDDQGQDMVLTETIDDIRLILPIEQKIAKFMCEWPLVIDQSIKKRDVLHLATFLHDLSLLVFRLIDQQKIQSSDYLSDSEHKTARKLLLQAIDTFICEGTKILGIDIVEEFI